MNWLILSFNVLFALIAAMLGLLGLHTFRAVKHLGTGKSFWMPVFLSGALFLFGSIVTIFHEVNFSLTTLTDEVVQISQLLAICSLLVGIYSYSRKVSINLAEKFTIPENVAIPENIATETLEKEASVPMPSPIHERITYENPKTDIIPTCNHHFGHLRTLPKNASIPDECLSCSRIVECKHSLADTSESRVLSPLQHDQSDDQPTPQDNPPPRQLLNQ